MVADVLASLEEKFAATYPNGFTVDDVKYPEVPGDRLMDINYTSGTTGFSKGVMITGNTLCGNIVFGINS